MIGIQQREGRVKHIAFWYSRRPGKGTCLSSFNTLNYTHFLALVTADR